MISKSFTSTGSGSAANGDSFRPRISEDGGSVVFYSRATNLVPGDTNDKEDVFLYRISTNTMLRAVNASNQELNGRSLYPDVNGDGSKIVFETDSTNADLDQSVSGRQIYLWTLNPEGGGKSRLLPKEMDPLICPQLMNQETM